MTTASASKPLPTPPAATFANKSSASPRIANNTPANPPEKTSDAERDTQGDDEDDDFEFYNKFEREQVKTVIHSITAELKDRGADVEYLMIPFRPQQTNEKLLKLLNALFPMGNGQPVAEKHMLKIVKKTEPLTLFQGLKYIWCRLPEGQIIGWKAYLEFKAREKSKEYPRRAFLEIMPQCLKSPSHASIVYDFFDLIITLASNSRINKMSARKISKMSAIWAFGESIDQSSKTLDYDFTSTTALPNNSFQDGLDDWIPGTDAMFHLLLAFLKSFVPQELESAKLPLSLKSLLFNNDYPPKESTAYSSETILTIPLVTLQTDRFSRKPWQLLERCNELLDFTDHDAFQAREDYALLKSLFKKKNNVEGISRKMSQESRRLMKLMSTKHSTFQAGWAPRKCLPNESHLKEKIEVSRVDIDDYFIWAWLSTLSYEQTSDKKKTFGRSLILEFEFDGFKKWVLFQESDIVLESRKRQRQRDIEPSIASPTTNKHEPTQPQPEAARKVTPTYEKFQNRVPSSGSRSGDSSSGEVYHTVISKESLGKNSTKNNVNLHSIEQKISKWNPLNKVKKKGSRHSSSSSKEEIPAPDILQKKKESLLINPHQSIYQLPPIECDDDDFKDIFAIEGLSEDDDLDAKSLNLDPKPGRTPPPDDLYVPVKREVPDRNSSEEAMEELKGMVDDMMTDDIARLIVDDGSSTTANSTREIFEDFTKFDQYKPSNEDLTDTPTSASSAVPSLRLDKEVPPLRPTDTKPAPIIVPHIPDARGEVPPRRASPREAHQGTTQDFDKRLPEIRIEEPPEPTADRRSRSPPRVPIGSHHQPPRSQQSYPQPSRVPPTEPPRATPVADNYAPYAQREPSPPRPFVQPNYAMDRDAQRRQSPPRRVQGEQYEPVAAGYKQAPQPAGFPRHSYPGQYAQGAEPYTQNQQPPRPPVQPGHYPSTEHYAAQTRYNPAVTDPYAQRQHSPPRQPYQPNQYPAMTSPAAEPSRARQDPYTRQLPTSPPVPQHYYQQPPGPDGYPPRHSPTMPPEFYAQRRTQYQQPANEPYTSPELRYYKNERPTRQQYRNPAHGASPSPSRAVRSPPLPAPTNVPYAPQAPHANKLHGQTNRQQERKKLHNNIRNGNFGI